MTGGRQASALDRRQMAPHAIHLADAGPRFEQFAVDRLLVFETDPRQGQGHQGRTAAGYQAEHEIVSAQPLNEIEDALRCLQSRRIGYRVGGLDNLDPAAGHGIPVTRHHQPGERTGIMILKHARHRRRGLACTDDDQPAARRRRQKTRNAMMRLSRFDRCPEHILKQLTRIDCSTHSPIPSLTQFE